MFLSQVHEHLREDNLDLYYWVEIMGNTDAHTQARTQARTDRNAINDDKLKLLWKLFDRFGPPPNTIVRGRLNSKGWLEDDA